MKRILVTLSLVFAFSLVASAQSNSSVELENTLISSVKAKPKPKTNNTVKLVNANIASIGNKRKPTQPKKGFSVSGQGGSNSSGPIDQISMNLAGRKTKRTN